MTRSSSSPNACGGNDSGPGRYPSLDGGTGSFQGSNLALDHLFDIMLHQYRREVTRVRDDGYQPSCSKIRYASRNIRGGATNW